MGPGDCPLYCSLGCLPRKPHETGFLHCLGFRAFPLWNCELVIRLICTGCLKHQNFPCITKSRGDRQMRKAIHSFIHSLSHMFIHCYLRAGIRDVDFHTALLTKEQSGWVMTQKLCLQEVFRKYFDERMNDTAQWCSNLAARWKNNGEFKKKYSFQVSPPEICIELVRVEH